MATSLTILLDSPDLQVVRAVRPEALRSEVLVMDADLHAQLKDLAQPHRTPWDFMTHADLPALAKLEQEAVWFFSSAWRVPGELVDPMALAAYRHRRWLARFTWALFAIERVLDRLKPSRIMVIDEPLAHGLDRSPDERRAPFLQAIARWGAAQRGIPVELLAPPHAPEHTPADVRTEAAAHSPVARASPFTPRTPWALIFGVGVDAARQTSLVSELAREERLQTVHVIGAQTDATLLARLRSETGAIHEFELAPPAHDDPAELAATNASPDVATLPWPPGPVPDRLRGLFANEFLRPHFDFLAGPYSRAMRGHASRWHAAFARARPALVVCSYPAPIFDVASSMGIPTLMLPHGPMIVGEHRLYESLPRESMIGAVSEVHRQLLLRRGIEAPRIHITGDPGAPRLHAPPPADTPSPDSRGSRQPIRVLVLTAHTTHPARLGTLPEVDFVREAAVLEQLAALTTRVPCTLEIRSHPRYDHDRASFERLRRFAGPPGALELASPGSLADAIERCTLAVAPCGRSSAIPEASQMGKPVYLLIEAAVWFDTAAWGLQRWPLLRSVNELESELRTLAAQDAGDQRALLVPRAQQTAAAMQDWCAPMACPLARTAGVIAHVVLTGAAIEAPLTLPRPAAQAAGGACASAAAPG